jgi:hypothetical protein
MCADRDQLYVAAVGSVLGGVVRSGGRVKVFLHRGLLCIRKYYLTSDGRYDMIIDDEN